MAETLSLMEFLQALGADAELRTAFVHDPRGTLADHGLADLTPADVHDALVLVQDNETVAYSLDAYSLDAVAAAPPPPVPAGDDHEAAVRYLQGYLGEPTPATADEQWSDVDPDADVAADRSVPDDAPARPGEDLGYGAGAGSPDLGTDDLHDLDGLGSAGPDTDGPAAYPPGEELDDVHLGDADDVGPAGPDPHDDPGPSLLDGA